MFPIESLSAKAFTWQTAYGMALCSQLTYQPRNAIEHIAKNNWGFAKCDVLEVGPVLVFIASTDAAIVVAFRGTQNLANWIADLRIAGIRRNYGVVHQGFCETYESVTDALHVHVAPLAATRQLIFTGHSLGGAMATLALSDSVLKWPTAPAYTFGQPRVGREDFASFACSNFGDRLFRIVNDDDLITRLPPGFAHVGRLYHFDDAGSLKVSAAESEKSGSTELPALDEQTFRQMQQQLDEVRTVAYSKEIATESAEVGFEATAEGLFPSISDHRMDHYVAKVRRLAFETPHVDGNITVSRQMRAENLESETVRSAYGSTQSDSGGPVLIRLRSSSWTPPPGVRIHSRVGNFVTAHLSDVMLQVLVNDPLVMSIEASRDAGLRECGTSMSFVGATLVHKLPIPEQGDASIIGIIDSGIDVLHEAFRDAHGASRILAIWNQRETPQQGTSYVTPHQLFPEVFSQDYGVYYDATNIRAMVAGQTAVPHLLRDPDTDEVGNPAPGHGTHVSSIAAGRAAGVFAGGVAPDAKLIVVIPNMTTSPGDPPSLGYSNSHVDALSFLYSAAKEQTIGAGLPIAVNVSLGMNAGAHDGLSTLEAAFDAATDLGRKPGFVIIKSAGNEGNSGGHAQIDARHQGIVNVTWESKRRYRPRDYIEVWYEWHLDLEFWVKDPQGNQTAPVSGSNSTVKQVLGGNFCTLHLTEFHRDCGHHQLQITIVPDSSNIQVGNWTLEIFGKSVLGGNKTIHAWVERDRSRAVTFRTGDSNAMTISVPGTAKHVITVAACESAMPIQIPDFSSKGLTRDGRPKPELSAPGAMVTAAASNSPDTAAVVAMPGTSMAAPHVAGAIALAMSLRHKSSKTQLNANQLKAALMRTAKGRTGAHDPASGFGVLDVAAFIQYINALP
jgi:subtilisin family serine protease